MLAVIMQSRSLQSPHECCTVLELLAEHVVRAKHFTSPAVSIELEMTRSRAR